MKTTIHFSALAILLLTCSTAFAHPGIFPHEIITSETLHQLTHILMLLPLAIGVFFTGQWLLRKRSAASIKHKQ